jgi:hypothetical protein
MGLLLFFNARTRAFTQPVLTIHQQNDNKNFVFF